MTIIHWIESVRKLGISHFSEWIGEWIFTYNLDTLQVLQGATWRGSDLFRNTSACMFRSKRQWKSLQDGNSCSGRRWNNGDWRQFWNFSFYWTSWEMAASGRTSNGLMPLVPLCSLIQTSHPLMSFTNWWDLIGITMSGVCVCLHVFFSLCGRITVMVRVEHLVMMVSVRERG